MSCTTCHLLFHLPIYFEHKIPRIRVSFSKVIKTIAIFYFLCLGSNSTLYFIYFISVDTSEREKKKNLLNLVIEDFERTKQDDYFWVTFEHFYRKQHILRQFGHSILKPNHHGQVKPAQIPETLGAFQKSKDREQNKKIIQ